MNVRARNEDGFTLIELIITVLLTGLVTGALSTALMTALNGSQSTNQRIRESNDAQLIATYLTRDAQAAGGTDPSTGTRDTTLGVSLTDAAGCTSTTGTLVVRFAWNDWTSLTSSVPHVATYWYDSSTDELLRVTCSGSPLSVGTPLTLGSHIGSSPAIPAASCVPAADCPGMPDEVQLTISETNSPQSAASPYTYTLSASLRPQAENASSSNSTFAPLFALGGAASCPPNGNASGVDAEGSVTARVYGGVYVNATDLSGCPAVYDQAGYTAGPTSIFGGGSCTGGSCPPTTSYPNAIPDPFAALTPPSYTCTSGGNPSPVGGHYSGGKTFNQPLNSGSVTFDAGVYIFCKGVTFTSATVVGNNVLFYIVSGAFSASGNGSITLSPGSGYDGIVVWQAKTDSSTLSIQGNTSINWSGTVYVPSAEVDFYGTATTKVHAVVARTVSFQGNHTVTIGDPPATLPTITTASIPSPARKGVAYPATTINATGGAGTYTWSATGLPTGLSIDASTGVISGTPTAAGAFSPQVTVTDSFGDPAGRTYSLTVTGPTISGPASLPSWTVNRAYPSTTVTQTGGVGSITWSATGLPGGLAINAGTGVISGTPTATGSFLPVVTATDSTGAKDSRNYSFTINPAPAIATTSLPGASQGVAYSATVTGTGGTAPSTWSATGLPAGLTINAASGVISGTPTGTGTSSVALTLTDSVGATANKTLGLTVTAVPPTVTNVVLANANGQVAAGDTITITFSKALAVSTICGSWAGNGTNQSLSANNDVVVHLNNNAGTTGNDTVTVTSTACPTLHLGTLDLGSPNFVTATGTFSGSGGNKSSVAYTAATFTLTVTLGSGTSGASGVAAQTVAYTPSTSVTDTFGNAISGTYSFAGRRF